MVVKDDQRNRFGAFVTESFIPDNRIHGGGESFVFRLKNENFEHLLDKLPSKIEVPLAEKYKGPCQNIEIPYNVFDFKANYVWRWPGNQSFYHFMHCRIAISFNLV